MKTTTVFMLSCLLLFLSCDFMGSLNTDPEQEPVSKDTLQHIVVNKDSLDNILDSAKNTIDSSGIKDSINKYLDSINTMVSLCGSSDLSELADLDSLGSACEEWIESMLPAPENSITDRMVALGRGTVDGAQVLFCSGTGEAASALSGSEEAIEVYRYDSGVQSLVDTTLYIIKKILEFEGPVVSLSAILDYSGSMSDDEIDDNIEIFTDLFSVTSLTDRFETDIILFSDTVAVRLDFSSDADSISEYIKRDEDFKRSSTRLFDALGRGGNDLSERTAPIRLIIAATDGKENSSTEYTEKEDLYALLKQHRIPVIILGTLFADLEFMKEITRETGGIYIYSRTILDLKEEAIEIKNMFDNTVGVVLDSILSTTPPDSFAVEAGGKRVVFPSLP